MVNITSCRTSSFPRYLARRHAQRLLTKALALTSSSSEPEELQPGEEQLYSFYLPSLSAGEHEIKTTQKVTIPSNDKLTLKGKQKFTVVAPQYTLPDGSVHSVYPPQGHADTPEVLPHVVLNEPHLPWERIASRVKEEDKERNRVPWLAVLVFTQEELRITDPSFWEGTSLAKPVEQTTTLAVNMPLSDLGKVKCATPVRDRDETKADFIFVPSSLFNALVTDHALPKDQTQQNCCVSRYKWLAHMRQINTEGMANSSIDGEVGSFSIVISHRTGPLSITQPTPVVAHLVSIEDVEKMSFPVTDGLVGLCSLASWSYTCLPPDSLNVPDAFRHLGDNLDVLRPHKSIFEPLLEPNQPPEAKRIGERLKDGYTLTKYRTQTGEVCAAMYRGPLAPTLVKHHWKPLSNFGTDLQVMDKEIGVMDLTYSIAWQLGKTLALADQSFTTALGRIRLEVHTEATQNAKAEVLRSVGGYKSRDETLQDLAESIEALNQLGRGGRLGRGPVTRWKKKEFPVLDLAFDSDLMEPRFHKHAIPVMTRLASSKEGGIYNELNTHNSPDWMIVFSWVLDRMYLFGIPSHYLIPDPSHLPRESLRFFHIDVNWVEALIDGALSVANHMDNDDKVRTRIKEEINKYLKTPLAGLQYSPQIPTHGFLLRSELCTKFPDLIVEAPAPASHLGAPILRQENIDEGVMLALFDRVPGSDSFDSLVFRQPPHQQCFAAGEKLDATELKTAYKCIYTIPNPPKGSEPLAHSTCTRQDPEDPNSTFVWGDKVKNDIRTLRLPQWAQDVYKTIHDKMPGEFEEDLPTAAMVGIQLNDPMYYLEILLKKRDPRPLSALGDSGPRTFSMLEPRFKRALKMEEALADFPLDPSPPYSDADISVPLPSPEERRRLSRSKPSVFQPPPPCSRAMTVLESDEPLSMSSTPAWSPKFSYKVYAIGSKYSVPMIPHLPQDLIFSILLNNDGDQYELKEISIYVRMGSTKEARKNLMLDYKGPGSVMLSNLRFNVIPTNGQRNTLRLRLLPRSTENFVRLSKLKEMSFILNGVVVNVYDRDVEVETHVEEIYVDNIIRYQHDIQLVRASSN